MQSRTLILAATGAACRVGRESRAEFNELHAGVVCMDYETRTFLPGTTGEGDRRVPAYTYRLCLTKDPANSVPLAVAPPQELFDAVKAGVGDAEYVAVANRLVRGNVP